MVQIAWGLGNQGGFQNALATGMQMGAQARQAREQRDQRNALAAYAVDPNEANTAAVAQYAPGLVMQQREREAAGLRQQAEDQRARARERQADLPMMVRLLETATDEASYQRNLQAAQRYGIDTTGLPPQFDQQWRDQNLTTMKALTTKEGQEALSTAGKQAVDMGFQPGTREFQAKVTEIWQQNGAIPYTGANGETRLYIPGRTGTNGPEVGAVVGGYRFKGGDPSNQGSWEPVSGGGASNGTGNFPAGQ